MKYLVFALILMGILAFFIALILILMKPNRRRTNMEPFKNTFIAHRGLFNNVDLPENSYPAFEAAIDKNFGIELDVQLTKDNQLVVFHDGNINRMCGVKKKISSLTYEQLSSYKLLDTDLSVPLFEDVISLIDGKVPVIIEIKAHGAFMKATKMLVKRLESYKGIYCIQSFNPAIIRWLKVNKPDITRGILSNDYLRLPKKTLTQKFIVSNLLFNAWCKPDFISYNHEYPSKIALKVCKSFYNCNMVGWNIKSSENLDYAKKFFEVYIFDSFVPETKDKKEELTTQK
ncbi:MAG: glycerophosphodiester phosphodiesterase [Clostridia bacterium]|nr:glycerophosphodiester phosphodiesterase [Clostridia bacterium]